MAAPQDIRKIRLKNDYKEMCNIRGGIIQWREIIGKAPYVEGYELTVNIRSVIGRGPEYRDSHVIKITIPEGYPVTSPPEVEMITKPQPYHPNWFTSGRWCGGRWLSNEGLGHHVIRMIRTLQFDPEITNVKSPANDDATIWYKANSGRTFLPCDMQTLPDPTKPRFNIDMPEKKKFMIH